MTHLPASLDFLAGLEISNRFVDALPADPLNKNYARQVTHACYSRVAPKQFKAPHLIAWSPELAEAMGLPADIQCIDATQRAELAQVFSGSRLLPGMQPYAMCYGGHQFGHWAGQLGDGRAINLCEVSTGAQERQVIQLKGAGPTPYSRSADGFAVLRSSIREWLCSEAMHHLGVPTTRALSLVITGEAVVRDMFYDGRPKAELGAVVCRVAPSFLRFGNYEIFTSRGDIPRLRQLVDFTLAEHFPHLAPGSQADYLAFYREVCERTAALMVEWIRVGFVHGVMNTDNMSILGLTIDYGPYGWLEGYDLEWTPNTTDAQGRRYAYGQQPQIAQWNLAQLGNALYPLVEDIEALQEVFSSYQQCYTSLWQEMIARKLGFPAFEANSDLDLFMRLETLLQRTETDMTLFFRNLADVDVTQAADAQEDLALIQPLLESYYGNPLEDRSYLAAMGAWLRDYCQRAQQAPEPALARRQRMHAVNPRYVLRNYLAQRAIDRAERGDYAEIETLLDVMRQPYAEQPEYADYARKRPEWARDRAGCSMLSCSS